MNINGRRFIFTIYMYRKKQQILAESNVVVFQLELFIFFYQLCTTLTLTKMYLNVVLNVCTCLYYVLLTIYSFCIYSFRHVAYIYIYIMHTYLCVCVCQFVFYVKITRTRSYQNGCEIFVERKMFFNIRC